MWRLGNPRRLQPEKKRMNKNVIGALLLLVLGSIGIITWWALKPSVEEDADINNSDARNLGAPLRVAHDMYAGYYPLRSSQLRDRLITRGKFVLEFQDDGADYRQRVTKLNNGEVDLAVFTVDSYLLESYRLTKGDKDKHGFPGNIVAILSESKGSDAIIARDSVQTLEDLGKEGVKIAFTPNSPSHHLLKVVMTEMNVGALEQRQDWMVKTKGSDEALKLFQQGTVDAAVLWEPDITKAMKVSGAHKLIGSDQMSGLIVDVLVASDEVIKNRSSDLHLVLSQYFQVLYELRNDPTQLAAGIAKEGNISEDEAMASVKSIEWQSLDDNATKWLGIRVADSGTSQFQILDTVDYAVSILQKTGDFPRKDPLPKGGAFRLINSETIKRLKLHGVTGEITRGKKVKDPLTAGFDNISDQAWGKLKPLGSLKTRPIDFRPGRSVLTEEDELEIENLIGTLKRFPDARILVEGHTSIKGDRLANLDLSDARAQAVKDFMVDRYKIDPNRIRAVGIGSDQPFERNGIPYQEYLSKLARVEIRLVNKTY